MLENYMVLREEYDNVEPEVSCYCDTCKEAIYVEDRYMNFDGIKIWNDCIDDYMETAN